MTEINKSRLLKVLSVLLAAIILLCAIFTPKADAISEEDYYENAVLYWTNVERARHGLAALKTTDALSNASYTRAKELLTNYDHTRPNGQRWTTVFAANGISYGCAAENIAVGYSTPCSVVNAWMESTGHRNNILSEKYTYMGSGYYYSNSGYKNHWEQLFAGKVTYANARGTFYVAPTGLKLDKASLSLKVNGTGTVTGVPQPVYATEEVICTSSDPNTVCVVNTQVNVITVKGLRDGKATLTIRCGAYSKTLDVTVGSGKSASPYYDVSPDAKYFNAVMWATKNGITNGTDATHFSPDASCTRGQVVTFLWRAAGCPEPRRTTNPFVDVQKDSYCYKAVLWAYENGITNGTDASHFSPGKTIPKQQAIMLIYNYCGKPAVSGTEPYSDVTPGDYYYKAVLWAYKNGIAEGGSYFGVGNVCPRWQLVQYMYLAMN